jgi:hypothetical protein
MSEVQNDYRKYECPKCGYSFNWSPTRVYTTDCYCIGCKTLIIFASTAAQKLAIMTGNTEQLINHNPRREKEYCMDPKEINKDSVTEVLKARQSTHGEFRINSEYSIKLRNIANEAIQSQGKGDLLSYQEEAIFMICHKLARILIGNDKFADHWKDISGYAKLVSDRLEQDYPGDQK